MTELTNDEGELVPHYFGENGVPDFYANCLISRMFVKSVCSRVIL